MSLDEIKQLRSTADMIVGGYAFFKNEDSNIKVLQMRSPFHALVMSASGEVFETTMDDVEIDIVKGYWIKNQKHMEESYA